MIEIAFPIVVAVILLVAVLFIAITLLWPTSKITIDSEQESKWRSRDMGTIFRGRFWEKNSRIE